MVGTCDSPSVTGLDSTTALLNALDRCNVAICAWDVERDELEWTSAARRLLGLTANEPLPTALEGLASLVDADRDALAETLDGGKTTIQPSRRPTPLHLSGAAHGGRVLHGSLTEADVDPTQRREDELLRHFSTIASDYVYEVDLRVQPLRPRIVAGSFKQTTGYSPEQVAELGGWMALMHPDDQAGAAHALESLNEGAPLLSEYRIRHRDGSLRWLRDRVQPLRDGSGTIRWLVGGVQDITERKQLEQRLVASAKVESLAVMAGGLAHEFNNLLTILFGGLHDARTSFEHAGIPTPPGLEDATTAAERATDLTRSLLALARQERGDHEVVDLRRLLTGSTGLMQRTLPERVRLEVHTDDVPLPARISRQALQTVLLNLVLNARDAIEGAGTIRVSAAPHEGASGPPETRDGAFAVIAVRDDGAGIPGEVRQQLFDPFFTTKPPGQGTGLGLTLARSVAEQHGGAIAVESTEGVGTTMRLYLPLSDRELSDVRAAPSQFSSGHDATVLVLDDDELVRRSVSRMLAERGYTPVAVADAAAALARLESDDHGVDLVLSDVRMPGMDGLELAREVRRRHPRMPIVLMTGYVGDGAEPGVSPPFAWLDKPFTGRSLSVLLGELLEPTHEE